jgi:hypothetical protein
MAAFATEADLERARQDPEFRQALMAQGLEALIEALNRMHRSEPDSVSAHLMSEGTSLALDLADRLQRKVVFPGGSEAA